MTINDLQKMIDEAEKIVFFGGAGVSTESGLKDFRGEDGLSKKLVFNERPEVLLSRTYFENETSNFYKYYRETFLKQKVYPNKAHKYLAWLETKKDLTIVTQNIDGLHQMAGSKNVIELHGSIHRNYCTKTNKRYDGIDVILNAEDIPYSPDGGIIKPDVTLYEEPLNNRAITKAINKISEADLLIVAGTSLTVYPAANLIHYFNKSNIVAINRDFIPIPNFIQGNVGEIFAKLKLNK